MATLIGIKQQLNFSGLYTPTLLLYCDHNYQAFIIVQANQQILWHLTNPFGDVIFLVGTPPDTYCIFSAVLKDNVC